MNQKEIAQLFVNVLNSPQLSLEQIDVKNRMVQFVSLTEEDYRDLPWHNLPGLAHLGGDRAVLSVSLDGILEMTAGEFEPRSRMNFIFFHPFSCSTLFSKALALATDSVSLREPNISSLFIAKEHGDKEYERMLNLSLLLYSRCWPGKDGVVLKLVAGGRDFVDDFARVLPEAKFLFLRSDLPAFFAQVMKPNDKEDRKGFMRTGMRAVVSGEYPKDMPAMGDVEAMSDGETIGHYWAWNNRIQEIQTAQYPGRFISVDADEFLEEPEKILKQTAKKFGLKCNVKALSEAAGGGLFSKSSKYGHKFGGEDRKSAAREMVKKFPEELEAAVAAAARWKFKS